MQSSSNYTNCGGLFIPSTILSFFLLFKQIKNLLVVLGKIVSTKRCLSEILMSSRLARRSCCNLPSRNFLLPAIGHCTLGSQVTRVSYVVNK